MPYIYTPIQAFELRFKAFLSKQQGKSASVGGPGGVANQMYRFQQDPFSSGHPGMLEDTYDEAGPGQSDGHALQYQSHLSLHVYTIIAYISVYLCKVLVSAY